MSRLILLSMPKFLVLISFLLFSVGCPSLAQCVGKKIQTSYYPDTVGSKVKYSATIEMRKGYMSGICILLNDGSAIKGCLFNEFGISALDFVYYPERRKVKLLSVIQMLNKWYIKKILREDLVKVMENLRQGKFTYHDDKFKIAYNFTLLELDDATEE